MVPVGTTHLWMLRVRAHHSSASVHLPLLVGAQSVVVAAFLPPHHPGQCLGSGGGVSAPKGSLQAGSACFAGLLQPFVFCHEGLGVVAASNKYLAFELHFAQDTFSWRRWICEFRCIRNPDSFFGSWHSAKFTNPISTLPEHLHSTFPSHAKLPENTLTKKKTFLFPL